jgi:hypothetical protein
MINEKWLMKKAKPGFVQKGTNPEEVNCRTSGN